MQHLETRHSKYAAYCFFSAGRSGNQARSSPVVHFLRRQEFRVPLNFYGLSSLYFYGLSSIFFGKKNFYFFFLEKKPLNFYGLSSLFFGMRHSRFGASRFQYFLQECELNRPE